VFLLHHYPQEEFPAATGMQEAFSKNTHSQSTGEDAPSNTETVLRHIKKSFLSASRHFLYLPGVSHYPSHMQITHCSIVLGNVIVYVGYYKEVATVTSTGAGFVIWQAAVCTCTLQDHVITCICSQHAPDYNQLKQKKYQCEAVMLTMVASSEQYCLNSLRSKFSS